MIIRQNDDRYCSQLSVVQTGHLTCTAQKCGTLWESTVAKWRFQWENHLEMLGKLTGSMRFLHFLQGLEDMGMDQNWGSSRPHKNLSCLSKTARDGKSTVILTHIPVFGAKSPIYGHESSTLLLAVPFPQSRWWHPACLPGCREWQPWIMVSLSLPSPIWTPKYMVAS